MSALALRLPKPVQERWSLLCLLAGFVLCAVSYSLIVPLWEAPDEPEHFQYVRYLVQQGAIPLQLPTIQTDGNNEGKQPPLYYFLALPFVAGLDLHDADRIRLNPHAGWPGAPDGTAAATHVLDEGWPYHGVFLAAHRVRLLSVLLGAMTVALTYAVALACTGRGRTALLAAALVALLPGFLFASATIDNDTLLDTLATALLLVVVTIDEDNARWRALMFGLLSGLALLTKLDAITPVVVGLTAMALRLPGKRRKVVALGSMPTVPALAFWAWKVAAGERRLIGRPPQWPPSLPGIASPPDWTAPAQFARHFWTSLFGVFSWGSITLPVPLYILYSVVLLLGLVFALAAMRRPLVTLPPLRDVALLSCWPAAILAGMVAANVLVSETRVGMDHARLFYPALPAVATLVAFGWSQAAAAIPRVRWIAVLLLTAAGMLAIAIPWLVIRPVYAPPWPVSDAVPATATPVRDARFVDSVALAGVDLPTAPVGAGQGVFVTFYWEVQRPLASGMWLFVHVEGAGGQRAAAFDGTPSSSTLPLAYWRQGDVVFEREVLTFHQDAQPGTYAVKAGWYDPKTGVRVPLTAGGTEAIAGQVRVVAGTSG